MHVYMSFEIANNGWWKSEICISFCQFLMVTSPFNIQNVTHAWDVIY